MNDFGYTDAIIGLMCVTAALALILVTTYRCSYRRLQIEQQLFAESIVSNAESRRRAVNSLT
jgi:hypothetical protein